MKAAEYENCYKSLMAVSNKKLPAGLAMGVALNRNKMENAIKALEQTRSDILMRYIVKDEDGNPVREGEGYKIKTDMIIELNTEMEELYDRELDTDFEMISMDDIRKAFEDRYDGLTPEEICGLSFMTKG